MFFMLRLTEWKPRGGMFKLGSVASNMVLSSYILLKAHPEKSECTTMILNTDVDSIHIYRSCIVVCA